MELTIKVEDLQKHKLFIATPMYGGSNHGLYMKSCLDLQNLLTQYQIEVKFSFIFNESLITRARNYLVDEFLYRSNSTHLLFLDADIAFNPQDVLAMLALDKDIIGAPYPKKSVKWGNVKKAIVKSMMASYNNPDLVAQKVFRKAIKEGDLNALMNSTLPDGELPKLIGDYVFNPVKGTARFNVTDPLEVLEVGTGFMMTKRDVFTRFKEHYPDFRYKPDHVGQKNFDGSRYIHAFFDCFIDRGEGPGYGGSERYLSEDYAFCQRWRFMGGTIWLCPWMQTSHVGSYIFEGNMPAIAGYLGEI